MSGEEKLKLADPKTWAAGAPAVAVSMEHIFRESGALRGPVALAEMNQMGGFDCPSCAWPDPDHDRSIAEFCENGAKALASEVTTKRADAKFFAENSVSEMAEQTGWWYEQQGRITEPMILREGESHYQPISWDEAFRTVAKHLKSLASADEAIFYTSGRASNEAAFLYQLFARSLGTNNLPDCSNMCHESSGLALSESIGVGKGTVSMDDFLKADVILCVGQNPGTNHPRMLTTLEKAVKGGAKLVAVNPLREAGLIGFSHPQTVSGMLGLPTKLAAKYLQVRINGDLALFRGIGKALLELEAATPGSVVDQDFIDQETANYEAYRSSAAETGWAEIVRMSGIEEQEIRGLAEDLTKGSRNLITCWAMGLTQHKNSVATIREVVNVHLLLGAIGKDGAGVCPVRGHSNVQGDRTVGIWEKMSDAFLDALDRETGIKSPRQHGYDTVKSIHAMHRGKAKVFFGLGGNFLQASPDTDYTAEALLNCELTCHVSTKLNRSHLITGKTALILPCLGRSERDGDKRFVTCENSMGVVQLSRGILAPISKYLHSEVEIIAGVAAACFDRHHPVPWSWLAEDYDRIRSLIERVVPGFEDYNFRVQQDGGFYLPNPAKERNWRTPEKKAVFSTAGMNLFEVNPGRLVLQTLRSHDQFNTTIYGMNDRYRGIGHARKVILVNPDELRERGIKPGSKVDITSFCGTERRLAKEFSAVPYEMPRGSAAAYFPEANVLVPISSQAEGSGTPTSKSVEIEIAQSV